MPVSLRDKVVLVLGASSGIGRAVAQLFAAEGARVMAAARRENRLAELQSEMAKAGHAIEVHACDVSKPSEVDVLVLCFCVLFGFFVFLFFVFGFFFCGCFW